MFIKKFSKFVKPITLGLFVVVGLGLILGLSQKSNPIPFDLSLRIDSLNSVTYQEHMDVIRDIGDAVIDSGLRPDDILVFKGAKNVMQDFRKVYLKIHSLQQVTHGSIIDPKNFIVHEDSIAALVLEFDTLKSKMSPLGAQFSVQFPESPIHLSNLADSPFLLFAALTALETEILEVEKEFLSIHAARVGSKDLKFDVFPGIPSFERLDSVSVSFYNESYNQIYENPFLDPTSSPLSTFSVDVDKASYSNVRRYLDLGILPPPDAVRIEELINYFNYDYPTPSGDKPLSIVTDYAQSPWNEQHNLLHIGLQAKDLTQEIDFEALPPNNLTFLIDVSGSMDSPQKLPLLKSAMKILTKKLRPKDKVSIVVYASNVGVVLNPTSGEDKERINQAIDALSAGGFTAGAQGLQMAYQLAKKNYIKSGNNRIILATDGDFNVGPSSDAEMFRLIKKYRDSGIFITCLGFGMGNYKDSKMETIADHGNGNYAYIDSENEANYVLGTGFTGTLYTVAKDVKLQIEFNPRYVQSYRLIGYENRILLPEDFNNDEVDAGDMGSGHTVTALYEIIPAGIQSEELTQVDALKYQKVKPNKKSKSSEIATIKFRYKHPSSKKSMKVVKEVDHELQSTTSDNFKLSTAVAEYGLLLRGSKFKASASYQSLIERVKQMKGSVQSEQTKEFVELAAIASEAGVF